MTVGLVTFLEVAASVPRLRPAALLQPLSLLATAGLAAPVQPLLRPRLVSTLVVNAMLVGPTAVPLL